LLPQGQWSNSILKKMNGGPEYHSGKVQQIA